ncbi:MAG: glycoside hydrolase N-terminal domain-containing protein, partial [Planctomycetes bacterium]|nr:glycoside hydrolase N-terminal domain-containing protein [Planctomycetota bacterium]
MRFVSSRNSIAQRRRIMGRFRIALLALTVATMAGGAALAEDSQTSSGRFVLWYRSPAQDWEKQALPIGNGSLGGKIFGGVEKDRIQLNEDSLWTGDENPSGNYASMGAYQALGDLFIELPGHGEYKDYRREL